jgi:hypothetical protein
MGGNGLLRFAMLAAVAAALLAGPGCGSTFKLPTEQTANRVAPADKSYQMIATWTGLAGVTDVLLIPGPQLYLAFRGTGGGQGHVYEYSTTQPVPLATDRFQGVHNPGALAANATSVFVLDQGDTAAARAYRSPNWYELDCGQIPGVNRPIVDISQYWYVREYDIKGREVKSVFTDTTFAWVNGVAADANGRVYVSGVIFHCFVDPFDSRLRTLDNEYRIYRYARGISDRQVLGAENASDPLRLGVWGRDTAFVVGEGTGIGSTLDPRGLSWSPVTGAALFFADHGNNEVQKFDVLGSLGNSFKLDFCDADTTSLVAPTDVDVDAEGNAYVVDAGNRRVLRYDPDGRTCAQRVDVETNTLLQPLTGPTAAATLDFDNTNYVYVVDPPVNQVVVYRRRQ